MCHDQRQDFYKQAMANNKKLKFGNYCLFLEPIEGYLYQVILFHLHSAKLS